MKLKQWLYGATALAMLAACSERDIAPGGGDENKGPQFTKGISYLGISIELPAEVSTRAKDDGDQGNDNFDDGLESEYNVENAAILLFKGKDESSSKFVGAYVMGADESTDDPNGDNITTSFQRTIRVLNKPNLDTNERLYGLALVNYDEEHFIISSKIENESTYGDLKLTQVDGEDGFTLSRVKTNEATATTFKTFREKITKCPFVHTRSDKSVKSIFMTNAPLSDQKGTTSQPTGCKIITLAELGTKFESTELDAVKNPAGCIFVERGVAKVTCSSFPKTTTLQRSITDLNSSDLLVQDVELTVASVEWLIDNDEEESYIVRNATSDHTWWQFSSDNSAATTSPNRYRFIGNNNMADRLVVAGGNTNPDYDDNKTVHTNLYRTYWCEDPNYSSKKPHKDRTDDTQSDYVGYKAFVDNPTNSNVFASPSPLYPHENTFDIANQNYWNTTRVVFKVQFSSTVKLKAVSDGKGGYVAGYENDVTQNDCKMYALRGKLNTFYLKNDAENMLKRAVLSNFELKELIKKYKKDDISSVDFNENSFDITFGTQVTEDKTNSIEKDNYIVATLRFKSDFAEQNLKWKTEDNSNNTEVQNAVNARLDEIKIEANKTYHLVPFTNNTCYYVVYIQHFGDTYCKLPEKIVEGNKVADWIGVTTDEVYGANNDADDTNSKLYLGRYGMVRNNWYDIIVDKIGQLGRASVPDGNVDTSDDNQVEEFYLSARIHVLSWAKRTQHTTL